MSSVLAAHEIDEELPSKQRPTETDERKLKLVPGSLMKGEIRPGQGEARASDGDQVIFHCTVRTLDGVVAHSTRSEHGGKGFPERRVLGKSKMLLGLLQGLPTMLKGEIAMFRMKPDIHYGEVGCPISAPENIPEGIDLHFEIEMIDFFKAKVITDDFGVVKKVLSEGRGWETPREPYEVIAWITAKTCDGKVIISRADEPYFFTMGKSEIPRGLEIGVKTMTQKEKAEIYASSQYLTESPLMPSIGSFDDVNFEVELIRFIQVRDILGDGRLIKRRIRDGQGEFPVDCPLKDSLLHVHFKGMLSNGARTVFYDTRVDNKGCPLDFWSGEGLVPEGFEMAVRLMLPGEISLVTCPPDYAYDKFPRPPNVPEGAHVQWEIELLGFELPEAWEGLDFGSIMNEAEKIRKTGNRLFKEGKYDLAKAKYDAVLREFNHVNPQDDAEAKIFGDARELLYLNVAACYQRMGECRKAIEFCNKVLDVHPAHSKALYRRGMAFMTLGDFDESKNDFLTMVKVDKSTEADAVAALQKLKQKQEEVNRKARKQFRGIFDKASNASESEDCIDHCGGEIQSSVAEEDLNGEEQNRGMGWFSYLWDGYERLVSFFGFRRLVTM